MIWPTAVCPLLPPVSTSPVLPEPPHFSSSPVPVPWGTSMAAPFHVCTCSSHPQQTPFHGRMSGGCLINTQPNTQAVNPRKPPGHLTLLDLFSNCLLFTYCTFYYSTGHLLLESFVYQIFPLHNSELLEGRVTFSLIFQHLTKCLTSHQRSVISG